MKEVSSVKASHVPLAQFAAPTRFQKSVQIVAFGLSLSELLFNEISFNSKTSSYANVRCTILASFLNKIIALFPFVFFRRESF